MAPTDLDCQTSSHDMEKHHEKFSTFDRSGGNGINSPFSGKTCLEQHRHSNLQLALSDNVQTDQIYLDWKPSPYDLERHHEKFSIFYRSGENGINSPFSGTIYLEQHRHSTLQLALSDNVPTDQPYLDWKFLHTIWRSTVRNSAFFTVLEKWNKLTFFWNDLPRTTQTLQSPASSFR
jgi:hypothetical protein